MKKGIFVVLTTAVAVVLLELGSFAILSLVQGGAVSYGDLRRLRDSRQESSEAEAAAEEKDWREHRMTGPPALHPYIGYVANPFPDRRRGNPQLSAEAADYGVPMNTADLFRQVDEAEVVIGVFGGSFAANLAAGGNRLAGHLEKSSKALSGRKVTVLSFAVAGHKQPQQLMALNWFLALGVHLDMVINLDGFNEIALPSTTNIPKNYHPFYPRGWLLMVDDLDQELRRRLGEISYLRKRRAERAAWFSKLGFSMTAGLVWRVLDAPLSSRISRAEVELVEEERSPSANYQARGPKFAYESEDAMYDDLVAMWRRASLQMDGLCKSRGIRYLHFLQPNQYLPGAKPLSAEERRVAWDEGHPYKPAVEKAYPRLVRAGGELVREGVAFRDLTRVFADDGRTYYRDTCCHVNAQGNVLIAEAIARAIDESGR